MDLYVALRSAGSEVAQELRPRVVARAEEDRVRVRGGLLRARSHVQSAQAHVRTAGAVVRRELVGASRVGDVDLDGDEVRGVAVSDRRDMLVAQLDLVGLAEMRGKRCQTQRWEQRVLDRAVVWAGGLRQRREDQFDSHVVPP